MGSGKNIGVGSHSPPGDLPDTGLEPRSPALQADSLPSEPPEKTIFTIWDHQGSLLLKGAL